MLHARLLVVLLPRLLLAVTCEKKRILISNDTAHATIDGDQATCDAFWCRTTTVTNIADNSKSMAIHTRCNENGDENAFCEQRPSGVCYFATEDGIEMTEQTESAIIKICCCNQFMCNGTPYMVGCHNCTAEMEQHNGAMSDRTRTRIVLASLLSILVAALCI